jgi:hypothetical protein
LPNIRFVERPDQLEWVIDPSWENFRINAKGQKRDIMVWLETNTSHKVVIWSLGKFPVKGELGWIPILFGDLVHYHIYFEDSDEAMLFKLTWK